MNSSMKTGTKLGLIALVVALGCTFLWFALARAVEVPENRTAFVVVWLAAVTLGVAALVKGAGWVGRVTAVLAIIVGLFLPFTVSISRQEVASNAIQVGDMMPSFSAPDDRGELFDSELLRGKPVLIKFFRAHW
jgi:xanthine/uracil/vitamin C permease (AzgA family)